MSLMSSGSYIIVKYSSLVFEPSNIFFAYSYSEKHTEDLSNPAVVIINTSGCLLAPFQIQEHLIIHYQDVHGIHLL